MSEHYATSRHLSDITITTDGDEGITAEELTDIIANAIADEPGVQGVSIRATEDIGLGAEEVVVCHEHDTDFAYFPLSEASLRIANDENNHEPYMDARHDVPPLFEF